MPVTVFMLTLLLAHTALPLCEVTSSFFVQHNYKFCGYKEEL